MALSILNSIASLRAEDSLTTTQTRLQGTLTQLSTGKRINSGSDDTAGLSISSGMQANIAALTQSQQNASDGIGILQTADGALAQVSSLLNRAVTLATEASSGGFSTGGADSQTQALDNEYQAILSEINQIGQTTDFNGQNVFTTTSMTSFTSTQASLATSTSLTPGSITTIADSATGGTFVYKATGGSNVSTLEAAIAAAATEGTLSAGTTGTLVGGKLQIGPNSGSTGITVTTNDAVLGPMNATTIGNNQSTVYMGDGVATGSANTTVTTAISALSASALSLNGSSLSSTGNAQSALVAITAAVGQVSGERGALGAGVNRLTASNSSMANTVTLLTAANNSIQNADIGLTVSNMTQYNVLMSTGMASLQQSNQAQQAVLKLVQ
jgi:flagellin